MALEGSLKEFNVADILQLIFFQKKTGVLLLQGRTDRVRVLFVEGNIVGAESRKRSVEKRLGMVLLKRGVITREDIVAAIEKQRAEGGKFGHVLIKENLVTKEQVQEILTFQISEVLAQMFGMKEGRYEFKPQSIPVDKELGVVLNTEHFLMEGVRLVDEWSQIEGRITLDDVFLETEAAAGAELDETERRIMEYVDGEHDIADITDITGIDSFTVSSAILNMAERGIVEKYVPEVEDPAAKAKPKRVVTPIPGLKAIVASTIAIGFLASLAVFFFSSRGIAVYSASERLARLRTSIDAQFYRTGSYPVSIQGNDPWGNPIMYRPDKQDYLLVMLGPDAKLGTHDDLPLLPRERLFPPEPAPIVPPAPEPGAVNSTAAPAPAPAPAASGQ